MIVLTRIPSHKLIEAKRSINPTIVILPLFSLGSRCTGGLRGFSVELIERCEISNECGTGCVGGCSRSVIVIGYLCCAGAAFEDLQLGLANDDGVAGFDGFEPIEAVAELGDVGEVVALDDLLQRLNVRVLVQHRWVLRTR